MRDLRLIGVQDDGEHVLLADAGDARYRLPIDDALRAAARRDRPRLGQLQIEIGGLRPREVQELIRAGLSRAEVADRSGWTVEKVRRYEGPILAERDHVARLARGVIVGAGPGGQETLGARVAARLHERGVERDSAAWDSARGEGGVWSVTVTFAAGGRERTAIWRFDPRSHYLRAVNDDARWLSEDDSPAGAIPTPHVPGSTGADSVFDVEAHGGLRHHPAHANEDDLSDAVRAHARARSGATGRTHRPRGQSVPPAPTVIALPIADLAADDERAPSPVGEAALEDSAPGTSPAEGPAGPPTSPTGPFAPGQGPATEPEPPDASTSDTTANDPTTSDTPEEPVVDEPRPAPGSAAGRKGRARVPSWDDIVFGTKPRPGP